MTNDNVESCPLTNLVDDGLLQLYSADNSMVTWLEAVAMDRH